MKRLLDPDVAGQGQGGSSGDSAGQNVFTPDAGVAPQGASAAAPPPAAAPPEAAKPTVSLTADELADVLKKSGLVQQPAPQPAAPPKQYTQDDYDKMFNRARFTPAQMAELKAALASEDPSGAAAWMENAMAAVVKNAVTMAAFAIQDAEQRWGQRVQPLETHFTEQQQEKLKAEFYSEYKDLEQFGPIVEAVASKVMASGTQGTKVEVFKTIAEQSRAILKKVVPAGQQSGGGNGATKQPPSGMSTLSGGGQGGVSGGSGKGQQAKSPGHAVFD